MSMVSIKGKLPTKRCYVIVSNATKKGSKQVTIYGIGQDEMIRYIKRAPEFLHIQKESDEADRPSVGMSGARAPAQVA